MGGESKTSSTQSSTTNPWEPAQGPRFTGILGQLNGNLRKTGINGAETGALNTHRAERRKRDGQYAPAVQNYTKLLLSGGGATDQAGNVNQNYQNYYNQTNPLASNTNYNPMSTPGFSDALNTQIADITNGTNGQFAAAGRDFSGANSMALGRGISQGIAPTIAAQYNQNVQNQQGAAGNLYNAGNTNSGILAGLQQQKLAEPGRRASLRSGQARTRQRRRQRTLAGGSGSGAVFRFRRWGCLRRSAFRLPGSAAVHGPVSGHAADVGRAAVRDDCGRRWATSLNPSSRFGL
jgi:hypothetical protein